jgi:hypothetical protein
MKFTVERLALIRMVEQLAGRPAGQKRSDHIMRLYACQARVFVEANRVLAGVEALVLEDGACKVPRIRFLKVLRTFHPKKNLTIEVDASGLTIGGFTMGVSCFSPEVAPPADFQVFPVTDGWLVEPEPKGPPKPQMGRWLNSRWWE